MAQWCSGSDCEVFIPMGFHFSIQKGIYGRSFTLQDYDSGQTAVVKQGCVLQVYKCVETYTNFAMILQWSRWGPLRCQFRRYAWAGEINYVCRSSCNPVRQDCMQLCILSESFGPSVMVSQF